MYFFFMLFISSSLNKISQLTRRVYYLRVRDFAQILGHVFESENMKEATLVDPNALKNSL